MEKKVFTVEEANILVPRVNVIFERIFDLNESVRALSLDMKVLLDIWGQGIFQEKNTDHAFYMEKVQKREGLVKEIRERVLEINSLGCFVKDAEKGLVDFYHEREGEIIYLCWAHGDDRIRFWHGLGEGFQGRKPLELLRAK